VGVEVAVGLAVGVAVEVKVGLAVGVGDGVGIAVGVGVTVGVGVGRDCAQYLPPVLVKVLGKNPPQTTISLPVQTAVWESRAVGALVVVVAVQLSVIGLYLPPVFES
jgi:hypothetical protein